MMYFEGFKATARLVCRSYMIKTLIKSDLYTARCQQRLQGYISIIEYYKIIISYLCARLINDKMAKKKKKRSSREVKDIYTICSRASNAELVQCKE